MENRKFPLFVETENKEVILVGCGNIGMRRLMSLLNFNFTIEVICKHPDDVLIDLEEKGKIHIIRDYYKSQYMKDYFMVLGCTNNKDVNSLIYQDANMKGATFVSICDDASKCNFFFPALCLNEETTVGIVGSGKNHSLTRKIAAYIRNIIENKSYRKS